MSDTTKLLSEILRDANVRVCLCFVCKHRVIGFVCRCGCRRPLPAELL